MKVKSNVRAGAGVNSNSKKGLSTDSSSISTPDVVPVYVPPVSRCVGI
jgi:hypothetical protein